MGIRSLAGTHGPDDYTFDPGLELDGYRKETAFVATMDIVVARRQRNLQREVVEKTERLGQHWETGGISKE